MPEHYEQTFTNGLRDRNLKIVIVGGGLVGALAALHLGKKGHDVHLYEYREDIRKAQLVPGRSINLSLSVRGRAALAEVGLEEELLNHGIPMRGRMLHSIDGQTTIVPYDSNTNQCIYSVGRKHLNEVLLSATEKFPNIHVNFNQKMVSAQLEEGKVVFKNPNTAEQNEVSAELIIGCDGAYSTVRRQLLNRPGFNFSQTYIEHGYLELCIPPKGGDFAMPQNYLHIWPRGKFMMIALPNQDKTWTVTLFMPFENFHRLKSGEELLNFFSEYFPDAIPLIGKERLVKDFLRSRAQHLVSVKCNPYHFESKVLLLGDAAHAMVPFYGQGMNAGFEDCSILSEILNRPDMTIENALKEFSEIRRENAHAICDLAMYNYIEMRDLVRKKSFLLRKALDDFLFRLMPNTWVPLYNSVAFSRMPYQKCIENRKWQDKVLRQTACVTSTVFCGSLAILGIWLLKQKGFHFVDVVRFTQIK